MRLLRALLAIAGLALGVLAYRVQIEELGPFTTPARASAIVAVGWAFLVAGLVAWTRRPGNRMGPLLTASGFALLLRQLRYSHDSAVFTVFFALGELSYALVANSVLAYPTGFVRDRFERAFLRAAYTVALAFPLAILLVHDETRSLRFLDPTPHASSIVIAENGDLAVGLQKAFVVIAWGLLASIFIALIVRRLWQATPRARRMLAPLGIAAIAVALRAVFEGVFTFVPRPPEILYVYLFWWQICGFFALPLALLVGVLRSRLARGGVADLVIAIDHAPPRDLRDALARALADPTVELAFWLPGERRYVDADGAPFELPAGEARAVTLLEYDGDPLGAIVHDPILREEPRLVESVGAAARLALENARLHAEMLAQVSTIKESRARIVAAGDDERRRIERDIHDGAQQRLVALALQLRAAQREREIDPEVAALLDESVRELQSAVEELRELARGVHPAILTEEGLAAALESLSDRTPLPVELDVGEGRLPEQVEATAYFVACEALANVVKHAGASHASISARRRNGVLIVEVRDDGVGGASVWSGSGLRGLGDRVEALGGRLTVESPPGRGTRVVGEIPCES